MTAARLGSTQPEPMLDAAPSPIGGVHAAAGERRPAARVLRPQPPPPADRRERRQLLRAGAGDRAAPRRPSPGCAVSSRPVPDAWETDIGASPSSVGEHELDRPANRDRRRCRRPPAARAAGPSSRSGATRRRCAGGTRPGRPARARPRAAPAGCRARSAPARAARRPASSGSTECHCAEAATSPTPSRWPAVGQLVEALGERAEVVLRVQRGGAGVVRVDVVDHLAAGQRAGQRYRGGVEHQPAHRGGAEVQSEHVHRDHRTERGARPLVCPNAGKVTSRWPSVGVDMSDTSWRATMGMSDKFDEMGSDKLQDKATDAASGNKDKAKDGMQSAADKADEMTGGKQRRPDRQGYGRRGRQDGRVGRLDPAVTVCDAAHGSDPRASLPGGARRTGRFPRARATVQLGGPPTRRPTPARSNSRGRLRGGRRVSRRTGCPPAGDRPSPRKPPPSSTADRPAHGRPPVRAAPPRGRRRTSRSTPATVTTVDHARRHPADRRRAGPARSRWCRTGRSPSAASTCVDDGAPLECLRIASHADGRRSTTRSPRCPADPPVQPRRRLRHLRRRVRRDRRPRCCATRSAAARAPTSSSTGCSPRRSTATRCAAALAAFAPAAAPASGARTGRSWCTPAPARWSARPRNGTSASTTAWS